MFIRRCLILFLLVVGLALTTVQLWVVLFIYRPAVLTRTDPAAWGLRGSIAMKVRYADGTAITGWWRAPAGPGCPVVLIAHGRSANVSTRASVMRSLSEEGMGVLMFDYRGYGASAGSYSEPNLLQDTVAAYRWLRREGVPGRSIVVVGQSIGNSPAAKLAAQRPIGALVLVSPFTNLPDALAARLPWLPLRLVPWTRNRFDVGEPLRGFGGPTLLVTSAADGLVPVSNARKLQKLAGPARWLDVSPLRHEGMLQAIAEDGRLGDAIRLLVPRRITVPCRHRRQHRRVGPIVGV